MFETAEIGHKVSKEEFKSTVPVLSQELLLLQNRLRKEQNFQTILVFSGVDGAGKGETVGLLNYWMDSRWLVTRAYDDHEDGESGRPEFWKFWLDLPPRGRIGLFLSAWYSRPVIDHAYGKINDAELANKLERISKFERALAQDGALILKFWMHLSREGQEKRLKSLERDPLTKARVSKRDWQHWRMYDNFITTAEQVISTTNRGLAPWNIVEGADSNYRSLTVANILKDSLQQKLTLANSRSSKNKSHRLVQSNSSNAKSETIESSKSELKGSKPSKSKSKTILASLDMNKEISKKKYREELLELQAKLHKLHLAAKSNKISSMLVFEGPDAAGKGGAIRRITQSLEARNFQVHGFSAPTDEEKAQHHLWRFWRRLPQAGHISIFDRSWYGRVLVERVEGFATEAEWKRSFAEINEFESQLHECGIVLVKFWLHVTKEEQLKRFKLREETPHKKWKLTEEDWRNRKKWTEYLVAVDDMVQYTSTSQSPWILIEGNDKRFARIKALETFCNRLKAATEETKRVK